MGAIEAVAPSLGVQLTTVGYRRQPHHQGEHELRAFSGTAQSEDQVIAEEREASALKEDDQRMRPRRFG